MMYSTRISTLMAAVVLLVTGCASSPVTQDEVIFYPPPPQMPRVQFLTSITTEEDISGGKSALREFLVGESVKYGKAIMRPWDIEHLPGKVYVTDKSLQTVLILDLENQVFDSIKDKKGGAFRNVYGLFITADGYKYIADRDRRQIVVFNERDEYSHTYGTEGQFYPVDVVVRDDRVYALDTTMHDIKVIDRNTGELIEILGGVGREDGAFNRPTHMNIDDSGNIFVTDAYNFRYQMLDADGKFVKNIGWEGAGPGGVVRPKGLDIDRDGHLYTADAGMQIVEIFDVEAAHILMDFGKFDTGSGSTYMPNGVHIDYDNVGYFRQFSDPGFELEYLIYVGNLLGNHKLNVYGFGKWTGDNLEGYRGAPDIRDRRQTSVPALDQLEETEGLGDADSENR